jgi:hypothetical protein
MYSVRGMAALVIGLQIAKALGCGAVGAAEPNAKDILLGCWDVPVYSEESSQTLCFEAGGLVSTIWMGIEEGLGGEGTFDVTGNQLHLRLNEETLVDGWIFSGDDPSSFRCTYKTGNGLLVLTDCTNGVASIGFRRAGADPMLRELPPDRVVPTEDLGDAIASCWHSYGFRRDPDITVLCFGANGELTARTVRGTIEAPEDVELQGRYEMTKDRVRIIGSEGKGWAFDVASVDCRAVIARHSILRLGECVDAATGTALAIGIMRFYRDRPESAAEPAERLKGCWELRDTIRELSRRAEDPFYASMATYCFDVEVPGELVTRAAEFSGYKDDDGNWVNGGGDGWQEGFPYAIEGDRVVVDGIWNCAFWASNDILRLTQCESATIEDSTWDRVWR